MPDNYLFGIYFLLVLAQAVKLPLDTVRQTGITILWCSYQHPLSLHAMPIHETTLFESILLELYFHVQ